MCRIPELVPLAPSAELGLGLEQRHRDAPPRERQRDRAADDPAADDRDLDVVLRTPLTLVGAQALSSRHPIGAIFTPLGA